MRIQYLSKNIKYDYIFSFDSLYFLRNNIEIFIKNALKSLKAKGKLIIFYSAWKGKDENIDFDNNILGKLLNKKNINFVYTNFSNDDKEHWLAKEKSLMKLEKLFKEEGNEILFNKRKLETEYFVEYIKNGVVSRFLYIISK